MKNKNTTTRKGRNFRSVATEPYESLTRFADMLKLRSLADSARHEYSRKREDGGDSNSARRVTDASARHAGVKKHSIRATCAS
jgi:hypothetical protein